MKLLTPPLFERLAAAQTVLLAGAGGGFDVYCGLPLLFALREAGKRVHLGNLTFSDLRAAGHARLHPEVVEVTADTPGTDGYFPERYLCQWFRERGEEVSVWTFEKTGVAPLTEAYRAVLEHLGVDALVLVDGGTDILMRGDEAGLGTPHEDIASLAAAHAQATPTKLVVCLGFGVDAYHGVCHAHFLEGVAELAREGAYLGAVSVLGGMPEAAHYLDAVAHAERLVASRPSIVNASIASAIEGHYGDHHRNHRTAGSRLWINPLMSQYFGFELDPLARRVLYLDHLRDTRTMFEIGAVIEAFRKSTRIRAREPIPV